MVSFACLALLLPLSAAEVILSPVWFNDLMQERECSFSRMVYSGGKCELKMFFKGSYPHYMQIIGLGLNDQLKPNTTEFGQAICNCGVMEVKGSCSPQLISVLTELRGHCGEENIRTIPPRGMTQQQWVNREQPTVYTTIHEPVERQSPADSGAAYDYAGAYF